MKKVISAFLLMVIILSLFTACANKNGSDVSSGDGSSSVLTQNSENTSTLSDVSNGENNNETLFYININNMMVGDSTASLESEYEYSEKTGANTKIVFWTDKIIKELKLIKVTDINENKKEAAASEILYYIDELNSEESFMVELNLSAEDIYNGISYKDENNATKYFYIKTHETEGISFVEFENTNKTVIAYANDEILGCYDSFFTYKDDISAETIIVITETALKNFNYVEIEYDIETGEANVKNVLFTIDELTPEKPFVANTHIVESVPVRGITYIDENNNTKFFMIRYDVMYGMLLLTEF